MIVGTIVTWAEVRKTEDALDKVQAARKDEQAYISETFPLIDRITMTAMAQATRLNYGEADPTIREDRISTYQLAERFYRRASRLTPSDPDNPESRTIIARAYSRLGFTQAVLSAAEASKSASDPRPKAPAAGQSSRLMALAEGDYRRSIELFEKLLAESPGDRKIRRFYADALGSWGWGWYLSMGKRLREAEPHYRLAIQLWRDLVRDTVDPGETPAISGQRSGVESEDFLSLVESVQALASILDNTGRAPEADEQRRQLEQDTAFVARRFAGPDHRNLRQYWARQLVGYGQMSSSQDDRRSATANLRMAFTLDPDSGLVLNNLAWELASVPADPWFDPTRALALARKAVAINPTSWMFWNTLGVSAYRVNDWETAEEALRKAIKLDASGGRADNWFFLAMTRWHQGHCNDARQLFDQAVAWMNKEKSEDPQLKRFQAEAARLLNPPGPEPGRGPIETDKVKAPTPKKTATTCPDQAIRFAYPFVSLLGRW